MLLVFSSFVIFNCICSAKAAEIPEEYREFGASVPDDVAQMLPEGFFSDEADEVAAALNEALSARSVLGLLRGLLSGGMPDAFAMFAALVCLMVLSALLDILADGFSSSGLKSAVNYATSVSLAGVIAALQFPGIIAADAFFRRICIMMNSIIPVMTALYLAGGNTGAAAVNASSLIVRINLIELCATSVVMPAVCACISLILADSLKRGGGSLSGVVSWIKHTLAFVFGLGSALLMASLAAQNLIASAGDNAGARAVKFLAGNMIPIVGSTVGDTVRTLAASVKLLRSTVGVAGMITLGVLLLPFLCELFLTRWALNAAAAVGQMIGSDWTAKICREIASLYGYVIAAAAMASVTCVLSLTLFAISTPAIGGCL
jgi:stage III sporulation protein AE